MLLLEVHHFGGKTGMDQKKHAERAATHRASLPSATTLAHTSLTHSQYFIKILFTHQTCTTPAHTTFALHARNGLDQSRPRAPPTLRAFSHHWSIWPKSFGFSRSILADRAYVRPLASSLLSPHRVPNPQPLLLV